MFTSEIVVQIFLDMYIYPHTQVFHNVFVFAEDIDDFISFRKAKWQKEIVELQDSTLITVGYTETSSVAHTIIHPLLYYFMQMNNIKYDICYYYKL